MSDYVNGWTPVAKAPMGADAKAEKAGAEKQSAELKTAITQAMSAAQMATAAAQLAAAAASNIEKLHTELADKIAQAVTEKMASAHMDLHTAMTNWMGSVDKALSAPRKITLERDKQGRPVSATSEVG